MRQCWSYWCHCKGTPAAHIIPLFSSPRETSHWNFSDGKNTSASPYLGEQHTHTRAESTFREHNIHTLAAKISLRADRISNKKVLGEPPIEQLAGVKLLSSLLGCSFVCYFWQRPRQNSHVFAQQNPVRERAAHKRVWVCLAILLFNNNTYAQATEIHTDRYAKGVYVYRRLERGVYTVQGFPFTTMANRPQRSPWWLCWENL